jgi:hypothetical protein
MGTYEKMRSEYDKQKHNAELRGWQVALEGSVVDQDGWWVAWMNYWQAMDEYERDPSGGRPVIPHRSG